MKYFGGKVGLNYMSPGRINLIGEHTDYNGGFVLPGAIDRGIWLEILPTNDGKVSLYAENLKQEYTFTLQDDNLPKPNWARYIYGVCREMLKKQISITGFKAVFSGNIPIGAGLSSSAALESVFAFAINDIFANSKLTKMELAKIGQITEYQYCGMKCGIMDQFASLYGKSNHLVRLDTRSLAYEYVPFQPQDYRLVLVDSSVKHKFASSAAHTYNQRRQSCENVVAVIQKQYENIEFLRDVTMDILNEVKSKITLEDYRRATYVIEENQRVVEVCEALKKDDYETVGQKMYETHQGMSQLYEVSCAELDILNRVALKTGVIGSRIMGGGFGGCTINLLKSSLYEYFIEKVLRAFYDSYHIYPPIYEVNISDGTRRLFV